LKHFNLSKKKKLKREFAKVAVVVELSFLINLVENRGSDWNRCDLSPKTFQFFTIFNWSYAKVEMELIII